MENKRPKLNKEYEDSKKEMKVKSIYVLLGIIYGVVLMYLFKR